MDKKSILIIGAAGELGKLICKEINENYSGEWSLHLGDRNSEIGNQLAGYYKASFYYINLDNKKEMLELLKSMDAVIVAMKQNEPLIQEYCFESNTLCVDVTAFASFADKVKNIYEMNGYNETASVIMAGFFPGLSGILLKEAMKGMEEIEQADIILVQNISAIAGITGMMDMFTIIGESTEYGFKDEKIPTKGFEQKREIKPNGADRKFEVRLIHHSEKEWLLRKFPLSNIHYWTGWNKSFFNRLLFFLNQKQWFKNWVQKPAHPFLKKFRKKSKPKDETAYLVVSAQGIEKGLDKKVEWHVKTFSDYGITAVVAAAVTDLILKMKTDGVCHPAEVLTWEDLQPKIMRENIEITKRES